MNCQQKSARWCSG